MTAVGSKMEPIRNCCVMEISTWNPQRDGGDEEITYLDLGSVSQITKTIENPTRILAKDAPSRARQLVQGGDILVSTVRPNLNGVASVPDALDGATASTGFCVLRPDPEKVFSRYLFHWVKSPTFVSDMTSKATGASYPAVSDRIVLDSLLPLPELHEQQRIAAILDQADALRAKRRLALAKLDTLTQSLFLELFGSPKQNPKGWPLVNLVDVCSPKQWPTISTAELLDEGFPVFGANGQIGHYSEYNHEFPTVLVTCRGATCGTINVCPPQCYVTGNAMALDNPDVTQINNAYLEWVLRLRGMTDTISGTAQPQITRQGLQSVKFPLPPLSDQSCFEQQLTSATSLKSFQTNSLAKMDLLFASLQHRAFKGEL